MNDKIYWVWLQCALGIGNSIKSDSIVSYFGSAKEVYFAGEREWKISGVFTPTQIKKLQNTKLDCAEKIIEQCAVNGWKIVTPDDEKNYPSMLFKLPNLPLVLYINGDLDCLKNRITIGVIGSRDATRNSVCVARALCASMARAGAVIVSGGALGIDSAAHNGALDEKSKTVAVLGCGFNSGYLSSNKELRSVISKNGALVTEYPPDTEALGRNFPYRNRLISGLSYGVVVIEAGERSGSLSTARWALEQGRDVFAVPGDITSGLHVGTNRLIRDGAKTVLCAMDVLEEYAAMYPDFIDADKIDSQLKMKTYADPPTHKPLTDNPKRQKIGESKFILSPEPALLSPNAKLVYRAFDSQTKQAEELIMKTKLSTGDFMSAVTEMEILGLVESMPGKIYKLIN